jgi:hypothetical protein
LIERISLFVVAAFGAFLVGVSAYALARPRRAIALIGKFASSPLIHFSELSFRAFIGFAFIIAAEETRFALAFTIFGAMMLLSALVLMALPRRWHSAYATFWSRSMPVAAIYVAAPVTLLAGAALITEVARTL